MAYGSATTPGDATLPPAIGPDSNGLWLLGSDVDLARRLGASGFDWVALYAQHGAIDRQAGR
ncbi:MAG: hypothetical protein LCH66_06290 [Actinobacteria bacterium]|nr:hypothetical protein [Actinomycetota bacterium]